MGQHQKNECLTDNGQETGRLRISKQLRGKRKLRQNRPRLAGVPEENKRMTLRMCKEKEYCYPGRRRDRREASIF